VSSTETSRRLFDLGFAAVGCVVFAPVVAAASTAILVSDGAPVVFRQERVGLGRRRFSVLKLRTMRDGRVTRVGGWLRATGIDETLQFLNVLRGEMGMCGPRPLTPDDVARLGLAEPANDFRFSVRPGITGLAQLFAGRGRSHSRRLDRLQVARSSLALDTLVVFASFVVNVLGKKKTQHLLQRLRMHRRRSRAPHRP